MTIETVHECFLQISKENLIGCESTMEDECLETGL